MRVERQDAAPQKFGTLVVGLLALLVLPRAAAEPTAKGPSASQLLPPTTVIYAELSALPEVLQYVLEHPLRPKFDSLPQVKAAYEKKEYLDFRAAMAVIESQMGLPWRKILAATAGGEIAVGIDAKSEGLAVLVKGQDDTSQSKLLETLVKLAKADATSKGNPDPVKTGEHRGITGYGVGKASIAVLGRWLVIANKSEMLQWMVDGHLDHPAATLATNGVFQTARAKMPAQRLAWGWVNSEALRTAGVAKQFYSGRTENPLAELLFGGIASTLQHTPFLTATLTAAGGKAELTFAAPYDKSWGGAAREFYFGRDGGGVAPPALAAKNTLLSLRAYRDISQMWLRAGDLFDENTNEELAKADSNLSTLFGGKDFGEDILGAFAPEMQLLVTRQEFPDGQPQPAIKLPAFAFVFQLKDPQKMQPELRRTFQSLIGFLNVVGAMNNQPQLDLDMEKENDVQLVTSTYLMDGKYKDPSGLRLHYNFSPSVAFVGDRIVISSTKNLARELAAAKPAESGAAKNATSSGNVNTELNFDVAHVRTALSDNRGQLIAQNMVQEGHTKEEAEQAIDLLLELVGWVKGAAVGLKTSDQELRLSVSVSLNGSGGP